MRAGCFQFEKDLRLYWLICLCHINITYPNLWILGKAPTPGGTTSASSPSSSSAPGLQTAPGDLAQKKQGFTFRFAALWILNITHTTEEKSDERAAWMRPDVCFTDEISGYFNNRAPACGPRGGCSELLIA